MLKLHLVLQVAEVQAPIVCFGSGWGVLKGDLRNWPSAVEKDPRAFEVRHLRKNKEAAE